MKYGKGPVTGQTILRVTGQDFDPVEASASESGDRKVLFRDYEIEWDIPKSASLKDIDVPPDAAKPKTPKKTLPSNV